MFLLLLMLAAFLAGILFYESKRGFGKLLAFPVGAVFFVAIAAAILEVRACVTLLSAVFVCFRC